MATMNQPVALPRVPTEPRSTLRRTLGLFSTHKLELAAFFMLTVLSAALSLIPVFLIERIVNVITPDETGNVGDTGTLFVLVAAAVGIYVASGLLDVARAYVTQAVGQSIVFDLRRHLYGHLLRQSVRFHMSSATGAVIARVTEDVNQVELVLTATLAEFFKAIVTMGIAIALMFMLDWRLALLSVIVLVLWIYPTERVGRSQRELRRRFQAETGDMSTHIEETMSVSGAIVVRSFGRQPYEAARFDRSNEAMRQIAISRAMGARWIVMGTELFGYLAVLLVFTAGGAAVLSGNVELGTVVALAVLMQKTLTPFGLITRVNTQLVASMALFERVFNYLDLHVDVDDPVHARPIAKREVAVRFDRVTFAYPDTDEAALEDVSFEVPAGKMAALVGPSGAGKTTVTYMLQRFYDPTAGSITLNGVDLRDATLEDVADSVGAVLQDSFLFLDTLAENIRYGRLDATDEEVMDAARIAGLGSVIDELPEGLQTVVGARGYRLSGGQKQRVAIARAVLKNAPVLILDEATASLDSRLEREIQEATARLAVGRTTLVVAHRLSTVQAADLILVFEHGRIVERGRHEELLALGGLYATLHREQFASGAQSPALASGGG